MAEPRRAELKDQTDISGATVVIIEARFYDDIQEALLQGAIKELEAAGVGYDVISVPGALEIPAAIAIAMDASKKNGRQYDGAIALGCVVRGDTIHFEIVSMESSRALMDLAVARSRRSATASLPSTLRSRRGNAPAPTKLNKGGDAARAALTMMRIKKRLAKPL